MATQLPHRDTHPRPPAGKAGLQRSAIVAVLVALVLGCAGVARVAGKAAAPVPEALGLAAVAAKVDPCLADVTATLDVRGARSEGTGIVLSSTGEVLTNNHVIAGARSVTVTDVGNGRSYPAAVVGYDRPHDIAVLQLRGASGLKAIALGGGPDPAVGQAVVALGNADGTGGTPAMVRGTITGLGQAITTADRATATFAQLTGLIASTVGIAPGDSGGPLVSTAGAVVGINTAASPGSRFPSVTQAQAYAIPAAQAASIASQIQARRASATVHIGA
jgi:S1-C subfamily serine protease